MISVLMNENIQLIIGVKMTGELKVGGTGGQCPQIRHRIPPGTVLPRRLPLSGIILVEEENDQFRLIKINQNIRLARNIRCLKDCPITFILCVKVVTLKYHCVK